MISQLWGGDIIGCNSYRQRQFWEIFSGSVRHVLRAATLLLCCYQSKMVDICPYRVNISYREKFRLIMSKETSWYLRLVYGNDFSRCALIGVQLTNMLSLAYIRCKCVTEFHIQIMINSKNNGCATKVWETHSKGSRVPNQVPTLTQVSRHDQRHLSTIYDPLVLEPPV